MTKYICKQIQSFGTSQVKSILRRTTIFARAVQLLSKNAPNCLHKMRKYFGNNKLHYVFEFCAESLKSSLATLKNMLLHGFSVYSVFK